jgi:hypothetical protein
MNVSPEIVLIGDFFKKFACIIKPAVESNGVPFNVFSNFETNFET